MIYVPKHSVSVTILLLLFVKGETPLPVHWMMDTTIFIAKFSILTTA